MRRQRDVRVRTPGGWYLPLKNVDGDDLFMRTLGRTRRPVAGEWSPSTLVPVEVDEAWLAQDERRCTICAVVIEGAEATERTLCRDCRSAVGRVAARHRRGEP